MHVCVSKHVCVHLCMHICSCADYAGANARKWTVGSDLPRFFLCMLPTSLLFTCIPATCWSLRAINCTKSIVAKSTALLCQISICHCLMTQQSVVLLLLQAIQGKVCLPLLEPSSSPILEFMTHEPRFLISLPMGLWWRKSGSLALLSPTLSVQAFGSW